MTFEQVVAIIQSSLKTAEFLARLTPTKKDDMAIVFAEKVFGDPEVLAAAKKLWDFLHPATPPTP